VNRCVPSGLFFLCLTTACTPVPRFSVREPVGPARPPVAQGPTRGQLVVYTPDNFVDANDAGHPRHQAYVLLKPDGSVVERIANLSGPFGQDPEVVPLPPGRYLVDAWAINFGPVSVPVQIDRGRTTTVHLDGESEPSLAAVSPSEVVSLPDGQRVGPGAD
jgi:hypothetical protein